MPFQTVAAQMIHHSCIACESMGSVFLSISHYMCIYIYMYLYLYLYLFVYLYRYVYIYIYVFVFISIFICIFISICIYIYIYIYMYLYLHILIFIYVYIQTYIISCISRPWKMLCSRSKFAGRREKKRHGSQVPRNSSVKRLNSLDLRQIFNSKVESQNSS